MKLRIICMQCFQDQGHPSNQVHTVEIQDDNIYSLTCDHGHKTRTVLQQQKFEILFDLGAMALLDGYHREAVTSFAASLERFYEFYIRVITIKFKIEKDKFDKAWSHIAAQSERQLGAYIFTYLLDHPTSETPIIDNEKPELVGTSKSKTKTWKDFRNAVVHKGYIPSSSETLAYGDMVYNHIYYLINELKHNSSEFIGKATVEYMTSVPPVSQSMAISTLISLIGDNQPVRLQDALKILQGEHGTWVSTPITRLLD
ncbi:conserved hypothetical protein [Crenothrix polyspora]|uniref:Uncharacterized protein n=1 Tax=Crenothrix polyspora TaxID=360316 RepID=A0A1R4HIQ3_9GAMM|nr:hypothetical protein [Crenothrix polyspora]SJM95891.1 conserved hypothetical protein [Crenothrix polyspora]